MKKYNKPLLTAYTAQNIVDQIGPSQSAYVQVELWRTSQLNQPKEQIVKIVKCPNSDIISKIDSKAA